MNRLLLVLVAHHRPARAAARRLAVGAAHAAPRRGADVRRRGRHARPRGADPARRASPTRSPRCAWLDAARSRSSSTPSSRSHRSTSSASTRRERSPSRGFASSTSSSRRRRLRRHARAGALRAASPARNATLEAIAERFERRGRGAATSSSVLVPPPLRRGAVRRQLVDPRRAGAVRPRAAYRPRVAEESRNGHRVVALGLTPQDPRDAMPRRVAAPGIVVLAERLRPQAKQTVEYFRRQGVELTHPLRRRARDRARGRARVGIEPDAGDGRGRVTPEGKRETIERSTREAASSR